MNASTTHINDNADEAQFLAPETHQRAADQSAEQGELLTVAEAEAEFEVVETPRFLRRWLLTFSMVCSANTKPRGVTSTSSGHW